MRLTRFPARWAVYGLARLLTPRPIPEQMRRLPVVIVDILEIGLSEQAMPIVRALAEAGDLGVVVSVRDEHLDAFRAQHPALSQRVLVLSETELWMTECHPAVVLSFHPEHPSHVARRFARTRCARVVMPHGLVDKRTYIPPGVMRDSMRCQTDLLLLGPAGREGSLRHYARRHPIRYRRLRLHPVGYPKTDELLSPLRSPHELKSQLGLDPAAPVVCYAPTFQREASLQSRGEEIIRALASLPVNVVVKLHHASTRHPSQAENWVRAETGGKYWPEIVRNLELTHPNVKLAQGHDGNTFLKLADVLVSDGSGIAYEYLLLDRPVVFWDVPEFFDRFGRDTVQFWGRACGKVVRTLDALKEAVTSGVRQPAELSPQRRAMIDKLYYHPGSATRVAVETIRALAWERFPKA